MGLGLRGEAKPFSALKKKRLSVTSLTLLGNDSHFFIALPVSPRALPRLLTLGRVCLPWAVKKRVALSLLFYKV